MKQTKKKKEVRKAYLAYVDFKESPSSHAEILFKTKLMKLGSKKEQKMLQEYFKTRHKLRLFSNCIGVMKITSGNGEIFSL